MKKNRPYRYVLLSMLWLTPLSLIATHAEEPPQPTTEQASPQSPWAFNLSSYLWTAGLKGDFTAGSHSGSVDASFIDIWDKSRRPPLGFMGRLEIHYERFAFYVDGNYMNIQLKPAFGRVSQGIGSELGLMDYGLMYRIFGTPASGRSIKQATNVRMYWMFMSAREPSGWEIVSHTLGHSVCPSAAPPRTDSSQPLSLADASVSISR